MTLMPVIGIALASKWLLTILVLTIGLLLDGRIKGFLGKFGFFRVLFEVILVSALLTLIDWGLGYIDLFSLDVIIRTVLWFIVIVWVFYLDYFDALLLVLITYIAKSIFVVFFVKKVVSVLNI